MKLFRYSEIECWPGPGFEPGFTGCLHAGVPAVCKIYGLRRFIYLSAQYMFVDSKVYVRIWFPYDDKLIEFEIHIKEKICYMTDDFKVLYDYVLILS